MSGLFLVSYVVLWTLVLLQLVALAAVFRFLGSALLNSSGREPEGPAAGSFLGATLSYIPMLEGESRAMDSGTRPGLLIFMSTGCSACSSLRDGLARVAGDNSVMTGVFCAGQNDLAVQEWSSSLLDSGVRVVYDKDQRIALDLGIRATPFFVGVDSFGFVQLKGHVSDVETLTRIVGALRSRSEPEAFGETDKRRKAKEVIPA